MDLTEFDKIVINTSAGKDSQAMTDYVCRLARQQKVLDRVVLIHADLGPRVEWKGTKELAEEHARHYGVPLVVVQRSKGDLLTQVEERGMWPDNQNRFCTSDQKRDQVAKYHTQITNGLNLGWRARILNCIGLRADESPARAKKPVVQIDKRTSNGRREVTIWLPIHEWTTQQVWDTIKASGVRWHYAYDIGMPRLSCMFCIFAPEAALLLAGKHNPEALTEYVRVEDKIGHTFRHGFKIASIKEKLAAGVEPGRIQNWTM